MTPLTHLLLTQVPTPPPAPEGRGGLDALPPLLPDLPLSAPAQWAVLAGLVLLLLGVVALLLRGRKRKKAARLAPPAEPPALPSTQQKLEFHLPPSEAEAQKLAEARAKREQVQELEQQRREAAQAAESAADAQERARLVEQARLLKEQGEEAKKEEYRARKAAEAEARERQKREREEAARLEAEAKRRAEEEAAAQRRAEEEAARRRVEAEAGRTLAQGLDKTRTQGFMARLNAMFGGGERAVDEHTLAELEEVLFTADIGVKTASRLVEMAREKLRRNELASTERMKASIREEVEKIVDVPVPRTLDGGGPPHVVMVVGVNGAGKTTTIGKLAAKVTGVGKKVVLAAGDTFRAAATEQLDVWADRAQAELVKGQDAADPGSVVFDAVRRAQATGADLVIADTAGRLHTKAPLMEELKKVRRVMDKALPGAPHEVLLVLDATNGQNAIAQAKQFHEAVQITGIVLTKVDGTAKGGVIIGICDELKLPVVWVGVGEKISDLRRFDPHEFVAALFD